jgi:hypothetical protein
VFHGLGGAGKTQLALQTIEQTRDHWSDVVYVDTTSTETLMNSLKGFALDRKIGESHEDTLRWLGSYTKPWLLVFDNADDPTVGLQDYFPKGSHGRVLITTRSRDIVSLTRGPDSAYNVSSMESDEALQLLLGTARLEYESLSEDEKGSAASLVQVRCRIACDHLLTLGASIWETGRRVLGACNRAGWRIHLANILQNWSISRDVPEAAPGYAREVRAGALQGRGL